MSSLGLGKGFGHGAVRSSNLSGFELNKGHIIVRVLCGNYRKKEDENVEH